MDFKIIYNNKEIDCRILLTFKDEANDINYIVYNDGTRDFRNEEEIYASRYTIENGNYILSDIENEYEWDLIDNMLESKYKEIDQYEKNNSICG